MAEKFAADAMLGKLAKWLRIMGYDTIYLSRCQPAAIRTLIEEGRIFLTRDTRWEGTFEKVVFIFSDDVKEQLGQLKKEGRLESKDEAWFTRCMLCNSVLGEAPPETARENVPEYVFFEHPGGIRFCPSCRRFFWPGSHKKKMTAQLKAWGFQE